MTFERATWPRRTERLLVRPATAADALAAWEWRSRPAVSEWITRAATDLPTFVEQWADPESLAISLVVEHGGVPCGDLMVRVTDAWAQAEVRDRARDAQAELGWTLHPDLHGHGLATEMVRDAIALCFTELGVRRIEAHCFADNAASWRLMERVGMRRETHSVAESLHRTRGWLDGLSYAILREEWGRGLSGSGSGTSLG